MSTPVEHLPMIAKQITAAYKAGMTCEQRAFAEMLAPLFAAYTRAKDDPKAKIPTPLMAAIESVRSKFRWEPD